MTGTLSGWPTIVFGFIVGIISLMMISRVNKKNWVWVLPTVIVGLILAIALLAHGGNQLDETRQLQWSATHTEKRVPKMEYQFNGKDPDDVKIDGQDVIWIYPK